jgi:hypothetical protein
MVFIINAHDLHEIFSHSFSNRVVTKSSLQRSRNLLAEWLLELGTVKEWGYQLSQMSSLLNLKQEHRKGFLYRILQPLMMTIQLQRNPMDQLLMRTHHQRMAVYQLVMTIFSSVVRLWLSLHCVTFLLGGLSVLFLCVLCGFRIIAETKMISFLCMLIWF